MSEVKRPFSANSRPIPAQAAAFERWALPDVAGPVISRVREEKKAPVDNTVDLLRRKFRTQMGL